MGYFKTWGAPFVYLLLYPFIVVFGQIKDFLSMYKLYLLLILNSNMHWLKYIWCKIRIKQNLTLRTSLFHAESTRMIFFVQILRTILHHCCLSPRLVYHLVNSLFLWRFPILLRNVFSRKETRPVRERQIGQRD